MVEAHKSLVRQAADAFNERDVDEVVASMHSEAEVKLIGGFDGVMGHAFREKTECDASARNGLPPSRR